MSESGLTFEQWLNKVTEVVLPSGIAAQLGDVSMEDLVLSGDIPGTLVAEITEKTAKGQAIDTSEMLLNMEKYRALFDGVFYGSLRGVKVGEEKDGDGVVRNIYGPVTDEVRDAFSKRVRDKLFVLNLMQEDVNKVATFPEDEPDQGADAVPPGEGVQQAAE